MRECCRSLAVNTGHIVFASGPAIRMDTDSEYPTYHIRVVHSTKNGIKDPTTDEVTNGVQEHYCRFYLRPDGTWTRERSSAITSRNETRI